MDARIDPAGYGPFTFESDYRWRWKAWGWVVDGRFWPHRVEVRYKAGPCEHDTAPEGAITSTEDARAAGLLDGGPTAWWGWEPRPAECGCWDGLDVAPPVESLPVGGLSSTMLRQVRLGKVGEYLRQGARNVRDWEWDEPGFADFVEQLAEPPRPGGPGRPRVPLKTQLRRLAVLAETYDAGKTQAAAARRLKVSTETVRASVEWGRREGYWQEAGRGRRGGLTPKGEAAVAALGPRGSKR